MTRARNISRILSAQEISGDINLSGIVTATNFYGDGSNLTGIENAVTQNVSTSGLNVSGMTTLGNVTAGVATANQFSGNITGTAATFSGNVTIGGVLTYDDVTNVDSLGIITARSGVSIADSIFHTGDTNTAIRFPAADTFTAETGGSEAIRVDSSQRLLVGTNSSKTGLRLQVEGTTSSDGLSVRRNQSGSAAASIILAKSRGSSDGSATIVQDDDTLGTVQFSGADGTNDIAGAFIRAQVDGTPGTDDMPGRLIIATTADGASTPTERARIDSSGNLSIATPSALGKLHVRPADECNFVVREESTSLVLSAETNSGRDNNRLMTLEGNGFVFNVGGSEKLRLNSSGKITGVGFTGFLREGINIVSGKLSDNTTINIDHSMVHYFTTAESTTGIPNFTSTAGINTDLSVGETFSVNVITTAAAAGYSTGARIDAGATLPVLWNGGTDPSAGGSAGVDAYTYQVIKTGDEAFTILGNVSNFA